MYDTVILILKGRHFNRNNLPIETLRERINVEWENGIKTTKLGRVFYQGQCLGLKVNLYSNALKLYGSLCKSFYGNNIRVLNRKTTERAISRLSRQIGISLSEAQVVRLDLAANAFLKYHPSLYLTMIDFIPKRKVSKYPGTICLKGRYKRQLFYDKLRELKDKRQPIPKEFQDSNIVRFELLVRTNALLKRKVFAKDLYNETIYNELRKIWFSHLMKTPMKKPYKSSFLFEGRNKEILDWFSYEGIKKQGGLAEVLNKIDESRFLARSSVSQYYNLKQRVKLIYRRFEKNDEASKLSTEIQKELKRELVKAAFRPE